jgi:hypothetical protein
MSGTSNINSQNVSSGIPLSRIRIRDIMPIDRFLGQWQAQYSAALFEIGSALESE